MCGTLYVRMIGRLNFVTTGDFKEIDRNSLESPRTKKQRPLQLLHPYLEGFLKWGVPWSTPNPFEWDVPL